MPRVVKTIHMNISEKAYQLSLSYKKFKKSIKKSLVERMAEKHGVSALGLPEPGPIAKRALFDAQQKDVLSVRESGGNNAGKFVEIYLKIVGLVRGEPWCQAFVIFRLVKAAKTLGLELPKDLPRSGYTPTVANWGKKRGWWISRAQAQTQKVNPMPGDLVYFYKVSKGRIGHVGIVESVLPNGVWTIEGNAQPLTSLVLTTSGWKRMGDLTVGEQLINPVGANTFIESIYEQDVRPIYKVYFNDGRMVECSDNHLWEIQEKSRTHIWNTLKIQSYIDARKRTVQVPEISNFELFKESEKKIHPYLLGVLLGDGGLSHTSIRFTNKDEEVIEKMTLYLKELKLVKSNKSSIDYSIVSENHNNWLRKEIHRLNLNVTSEYKHIPNEYIESTFNDRLELLQGLMDTDGSCDKLGRLEYTSVSYKLIKDVQKLVWSLGGRAKIQTKHNVQYTSPNQKEKKSGKTAYRIAIILPKGIQPFSLNRKIARYDSNRNKSRGNASSPYIVSIEYDRMEKCRCIKTNNDRGLYITDNFIVTHNTGPDKGVQADGDGVYRKFRTWDSLGLYGGFVRLPF